jgi:predicted O-methyltransferase YrrM
LAKRRFLDEDLSSLVKSVEDHAKNLNILKIFEPYNFPDNILQAVESKPYYSNLAAYIDLYKIRSVLEVGTCTGASALAMSEYSEKVITYDVTDQSFHDPSIFSERNIESCIFVKPESCLEIDFKLFDMIFVDVDHGGNWEKLIHEKIVMSEFSGLVFYDDVGLNQEMEDFWRGITQEKLKTKWHETSFGIVRYL